MKTNIAGGPDVIVLPDDKESAIKCFKQVIPVTIHHYYIIDEIEEPDKYLELINTLKTAEQHDTIFIYLNTPGGYLNTAIQIMNAMKSSNATVITSMEGEVCSAGTLLFLSGDKFIINPNSTFMIHNYSAWIGGKGNEIAAHAKYREEYARELMNDVFKDFLTQDEIEQVLEGKDFWLGSKQVIKRLSDKEKVITDEVDIQSAISKLPAVLAKLLEEEETKHEKVKSAEPILEPKPKKNAKKPTKR